MTPKPWENAEGYTDPTAYTALRHIQQEENAELDAKVLKYIVSLSGFELINRIELRDKKSGRCFR